MTDPAPTSPRSPTSASPLPIRPLATDADARACAEIMATNEPWVTLGRTLEESYQIVRDPAREVYGRGLGSALITFAERRIFHDQPNVFICASSFNPGARRLYERLGYVAVGELTDFVVRGHSELLLRKTTGPLTEHLARLEPRRDPGPA